MNRPSQKNSTQITLFDTLGTKNKPTQQEQGEKADKKREDSPKQLRKSSRIQQQRVVQESQSIQPQKKQSSKVSTKQKGNVQAISGRQQTTLNYLRKDSNNLEVPKLQSQSMSQEISSIQSTIASPSIYIPKQDHQQFQKSVQDLNYDIIVPQLEQFQEFISSLLQNITTFLKDQRKPQQQKEEISSHQINKIEKQIRYILFRFITVSPFSMWNNLYCPQRVSQLIEEVNGKLIQLWIRKYYKGIKDKLKGESLFGYVDSDDDFSEYFDNNESNSNMNEEYTTLLNSNTCKNWKNKGNILVLNGTQGCGKTTALRSSIKSLKMQVIEINNSMKRGGVDLKKITEITQSCRLHNQQQGNEKQQPQSQKGTLNSFFAPKKKVASQDTGENEQKDQINIDAKDSSKKVIYFRDFDIQLDTLFQNEVLKLSENSKVPFILSINSDETACKQMGILNRDTVQFQQISDEQMTILLYIIFEVERNYRQFHFLSPLYVTSLVNEESNLPENPKQNETQEQVKESKEQTLLKSEEFKQFMTNFPANNTSEPQYLSIINKLVRIFNGDLSTSLSFLQDNIKMITKSSEFGIISKSIEYIQHRNLKLNNLNQIFLTHLPISQLSNQFKFNVENSYQIFLNSTYTPIPQQHKQLNNDESKEIEQLENYLTNIENISTLDVLEAKKDQIFQQSLICSEHYQELFYSPDRKLGVEKYWYSEERLQEDIENEIQQLSRNINQNQLYCEQTQQDQMMDENPSELIAISNFFQNNISQTLKDLQIQIFLEQFRNYDIHSDKVEKSDKIYIRKSQLYQYFQIIPILDTIKTNYLVGQKRTRSQQTKANKDIIANPQSIVEQTISKNLYDQFKIILSQFSQRKECSFSQNVQKDNSNLLSISNSLNGLSLQTQGSNNNSEIQLSIETNDIINKSNANLTEIEEIKIIIPGNFENDQQEDKERGQQEQNNVLQQDDKSNENNQNSNNSTQNRKEMDVEIVGQNSQMTQDQIIIRDGIQEQENVNPNTEVMLRDKDIKLFSSSNSDQSFLQLQQNQSHISQQV